MLPSVLFIITLWPGFVFGSLADYATVSGILADCLTLPQIAFIPAGRRYAQRDVLPSIHGVQQYPYS